MLKRGAWIHAFYISSSEEGELDLHKIKKNPLNYDQKNRMTKWWRHSWEMKKAIQPIAVLLLSAPEKLRPPTPESSLGRGNSIWWGKRGYCDVWRLNTLPGHLVASNKT
jgi:hypothetical protein